MALNPSVIYADLVSARAASPFPMAGISFDRLAQAISLAIPAWAVGQPANLALSGIASGTMGAGVINPATTKLVVAPNTPVVLQGLLGVGLAGPLASSLSIVLSLGLSASFTKVAQYTGSAAGVGVGIDSSLVSVVNPATLAGILQGFMAAVMGPGSAHPVMAQGIAIGVSELLRGGVGVGSVVGSPGPGPGAGPTNSVVI